MATPLKVDVWSDIACPWCFIGKRRLETALREFPHASEVQVEWRSFQLDPAAPRVRDKSLSNAERLAKKYGVSVERAKAMTDRLVGIAKEEGLDFDFDAMRSGNTFDAHRLLHLGKRKGLQEQLEERFMHGYLCEGAAIGDPETLQRLATDVGLDADDVQALLAGDLHARDVHTDVELARALGIDGVPFFKLGRYGISGAQPAELLLTGLQRAYDERREELEKLEADGPTCGPEGC